MRTLLLSLLALLVTAGAHAQNPLTLVGQYDGEAPGDVFGGTVTTGDFNADGFDDFIISAFGWNGDTGKNYFYPGGEAFPPQPAFTWQGQTPDEGYSARGNVGDLNGDGVDDFAVSALNLELLTNHSRLELHFGSPALDTIPDWVFWDPYQSWGTVWEADSAGDVNGDAVGDLLVSATRYENAQNVYIFFGGEGLDTIPDWVLSSIEYQIRFIDGLGDVNGDGYADIMIRQYQGPAAIYFGGSPMDTLPDVVIDQGQNVQGSAARDINGDGYTDVAFCWNFGGGSLSYDIVHLGQPDMNAVPDYTLMKWDSDTSVSLYGLSCGDFNGDGLGDIIGTSAYGGGMQTVQIFLGSGNFRNQADAFVSEWYMYEFGETVAAGDINGDGNDELLVTALNYPWFHQGRVYLFQGPEEWVDYGTAAVGPGIYPDMPEVFQLHPNYPNPFNPATTIRFDLPQAGYVRLEGFDTAGRRVYGARHASPLQAGEAWYPAGTHEVTFDGSGLPSGVYLVRLEAGDFVQTRKLVLLK
ncbi:MAG: T9SS C-terminal target domain-containing protein [Candidatus Zixiibacteriota bacterium]|nr:MAG: T9SS C-terminal target domain-containing protein [candidate division Zixibacteria bacterium]